MVSLEWDSLIGASCPMVGRAKWEGLPYWCFLACDGRGFHSWELCGRSPVVGGPFWSALWLVFSLQ